MDTIVQRGHLCHIKIGFGFNNYGRFVNKRASYPFGIISLAHVPVNVTDFSIGSINCNPNNPVATLTHLAIVPKEGAVLFELHKLCATFSASVNINYLLPIKIYCRICTLRHIRIEINHGSQNVF